MKRGLAARVWKGLDHYSDGFSLLMFLGVVALAPLVIGMLLASILFGLRGWDEDNLSLGWYAVFALPVAPYFFGAAFPHIHDFTKPKQ